MRAWCKYHNSNGRDARSGGLVMDYPRAGGHQLSLLKEKLL